MASCEDEEPSALSLLGGACRLNSDCDGGLVCAYGVCHEECARSSDCDGGRCVLGLNKVHLCQPDAAAACTFNSDCPEPLVCARDGECRNQCAADRDCVDQQVCRSATCAELSELDAGGRLPTSGSSLGRPCAYSSECGAEGDLTLVCRAGACAYACFEEKDCGRFYDCSTADDPAAPGNCELINDPAVLVCDPDDPGDLGDCFCFEPPTQVRCKPDGTGYDCQCP